jgi:hypothetical protein
VSEDQNDLNSFAHSLASARAHPGQLNRDAILFAAGFNAGRRQRFWPAASAALALLSLGLGLALLLRSPSPTVVEVVKIVEVEKPRTPQKDPDEESPTPPSRPEVQPPPLAAVPSPEWAEGQKLRERVFREGAGGLGPIAWPTGPNRESDLSRLRKDSLTSFEERQP